MIVATNVMPAVVAKVVAVVADDVATATKALSVEPSV